MSDTINLNQMIPTYRRETDDITGAVRMNTVEMVSMEQMGGGCFQIIVRATSGAQYYVTPVLLNLRTGREALEAYRARLGGEQPMYPVPKFVPETGLDVEELPGQVWEFSDEGPFDQAPDRTLKFHCDRYWRTARARHARAPKHRSRWQGRPTLAFRLGRLVSSPQFVASVGR